MYKNILKNILLGSFMLIGALGFAGAHDSEVSLSSELQEKIEERLSVFFKKVDSQDISERNSTYKAVIQKISEKIGDYEINSSNYLLLKTVEHLIIHKIEEISDSLSEDISQEDNKEQEKENTTSSSEVRNDLDEELNEYDKNILAGEKKGVLSLRLRSDLEPIKSEEVEFVFNQDIDDLGLVGLLYHDGVLIGKSQRSGTDGNRLRVTNIDNFIIGTKTSFLQLEIFPEVIGRDFVGKQKDNLIIVSTILRDNTGTITGDKIGSRVFSEDSRSFNIVPVDVEANIINEFSKNTSTAIVNLQAKAGNNNDDGDEFSPSLEGVTLNISALSQAGEITLLNASGNEIGSANITSSGEIFIPVVSDSIQSSGEDYTFITNVEAIFYIPKDGILYSAGGTNFESSFKKQLFLGQK